MNKKRRVDEHKDSVVSFSEATTFHLYDALDEGDKIQSIAMDSRRGVLYLVLTTPTYLNCPILRQVTFAEKLTSTLLTASVELRAFPPGLVAMIAAYDPVHTDRTFDVALSTHDIYHSIEVDRIQVDECSGHILCSLADLSSFIRVDPQTGTIRHIHKNPACEACPIWTQLTHHDHRSFDSSNRYIGLKRTEANQVMEFTWSGSLYHLVPLNGNTFPKALIIGDLIADHEDMYSVSWNHGYGAIYRKSALASAWQVILPFTDPTTVVSRLAWCGPRHLLFAHVNDRTDPENPETVTVDLCLLSLETCTIRPLMRHIPFNWQTSDLQFFVCYSSILVRSQSELRTLSLPSEVACT